MIAARLDNDEHDQRGDSPNERQQNQRIVKAKPGRFDEAVGQPGQTERHQQRADKIKPFGRVLVPALRHFEDQCRQRYQGQRHIDEEHRPPQALSRQPAANRRADQRRHGAEG